MGICFREVVSRSEFPEGGSFKYLARQMGTTQGHMELPQE